jgi:hypothetical protein
MAVMLATFAGLVIVILVGLLWAQPRFRLLQYLFFLRYPLVLGSLAVGLPVVSSYGPAAGMLDNLYVIEHWFAALWLGTATAWLFAVVWLCGELIFRGGDERFRLEFARNEDGGDQANDRWLHAKLGTRARRWGTVLVFMLAGLPMWIVLAMRSTSPGLHVSLAALGYVLVVAGMTRESKQRPLMAVADPLAPFVRLQQKAPWLQRQLESWRISDALRGYGDVRGHQVAALLFNVTALAYIAGAVLLPPWQAPELTQKFPAIVYVLMMLTLAAMVLPSLSYLLDPFRVPTLVCVIVVLLPLHLVSDHDHYFATPARESATSVDSVRAIEQRFADDPEPVLVVVASSGGGGQAAVWTSRVFEGLADEGDWGVRVLDSIGLVSTVSGGSVGAMYWVDAYTPAGPPSDRESIEQLRAAAESPTLEALVWGMVYPDTVRLLLPAASNRWFPLFDRARTMELSWNGRFIASEADPKNAPTLASWSQGVGEGWRPLLIFNATAVESGCRVLLGAASFARDAFAGAIVYPVDQYDLDVSTAARLSASFPYLSPTSRAEVEVVREADGERKSRARTCSDLEIGGQHLVDGGYYDNYGVVTAMQWLDQVLSADQSRRIRKVVIIEIRSMSKQFQRSEVALPGVVAQLTGPLSTLTSVRTSSQIDRNVESLQEFARAWAREGVVIESVAFEAHNEQRLSWSLTADTIDKVRSNWADDPEVVCARRRLCELVGGDACPAAPADGCEGKR